MVSPINPNPSYTYFLKVDLPGNNQQRGSTLPEISNPQRNNSESFPTSSIEQQKTDQSPKNIFLVLPNKSKTCESWKASQIVKDLLNNQQKKRTLSEISNSQMNNSENLLTNSPKRRKMNHISTEIGFEEIQQKDEEIRKLKIDLDEKNKENSKLKTENSKLRAKVADQARVELGLKIRLSEKARALVFKNDRING